MRITRPLCLLFACWIAFFALPSMAAESPAQQALNNAGVIKMLKAGLPESIVLREIQLSRTNFDASPNGLVELRKHGASEAVLGAVLDSWSSGGMPMSLPEGESAQFAGVNRPHMPSFQANMRVNRKVHEQLTMRPNHIELKGKGLPSVSVDWKSLPPSEH